MKLEGVMSFYIKLFFFSREKVNQIINVDIGYLW